MPVPMMAPMPSNVRSHAPRHLCNSPLCSSGCFVRSSCASFMVKNPCILHLKAYHQALPDANVPYNAPQGLFVMTDLLTAVFLGIIQGLTEFIPVSSTGHLVIFAQRLKFSSPGHVFE